LPVDLSVVVASVDGSRSRSACLDHLLTSCASLEAEILICEASDRGPEIADLPDRVTTWRFPSETLTPVLWGEGLRRANGRVVAFTTTHFLVGEHWARRLVEAVDAGAAGAGGPVVIAPGTGPLDWAVYFLRYSAFMPATLGAGRISGELAGDNAVYSRAALEPHRARLAQGVWDVDVHRWLRADGHGLVAVPEATAAYAASSRFRTIALHRFRHGRQYGAGRVSRGERSRWLVVCAAPAVPLVLALRAGRRVLGADRDLRFVLSLPWFLLLAGAWAVGEAWGALRGAGS